MASFSDLNTIAKDSNFRGRSLYALQVAAVNVMAEDPETSGHEARVAFARSVLSGSVDSYQIALGVLTNPSIAGEADVSLIATTAGVPDGDMQFAVNSLFNAFSGVAT